MKTLMVYRNAGKLQVVVEQEYQGQRIYLRRETVAELPPGYSRTARMIGEAFSAVHKIRTAWTPKNCTRCRQFGYEKENGQQVCRYGDNFNYSTYAYEAEFAQWCKNYRE